MDDVVGATAVEHVVVEAKLSEIAITPPALKPGDLESSIVKRLTPIAKRLGIGLLIGAAFYFGAGLIVPSASLAGNLLGLGATAVGIILGYAGSSRWLGSPGSNQLETRAVKTPEVHGWEMLTREVQAWFSAHLKELASGPRVSVENLANRLHLDLSPSHPAKLSNHE